MQLATATWAYRENEHVNNFQDQRLTSNIHLRNSILYGFLLVLMTDWLGGITIINGAWLKQLTLLACILRGHYTLSSLTFVSTSCTLLLACTRLPTGQFFLSFWFFNKRQFLMISERCPKHNERYIVSTYSTNNTKLQRRYVLWILFFSFFPPMYYIVYTKTHIQELGWVLIFSTLWNPVVIFVSRVFFLYSNLISRTRVQYVTEYGSCQGIFFSWLSFSVLSSNLQDYNKVELRILAPQIRPNLECTQRRETESRNPNHEALRHTFVLHFQDPFVVFGFSKSSVITGFAAERLHQKAKVISGRW